MLNGIAWRPTEIENSLMNKAVSQSVFIAKVSQSNAPAPPLHHYCIPFVSGLSGSRRPYAILGRVIPVYIKSLYCKARTPSFPHISKEIGKCVPAWTNTDSPCAIVFVGGVVRIVASCVHTIEAVVNRMFCKAVFRGTGNKSFGMITSTGARLALNQRLRSNRNFIAAGALAHPPRNVYAASFDFLWAWLNHGKPAKCFARQV